MSTSSLPDGATSGADPIETDRPARHARRIPMGKGTVWRFGSPLDHEGAEVFSFTKFPLMVQVDPLYRGQFLVGLSSFGRNAPGGSSFCGGSHVILRYSHIAVLAGRWKVRVTRSWRDHDEEQRSVADSALRRQARMLERALQPTSPLPPLHDA